MSAIDSLIPGLRDDDHDTRRRAQLVVYAIGIANLATILASGMMFWIGESQTGTNVLWTLPAQTSVYLVLLATRSPGIAGHFFVWIFFAELVADYGPAGGYSVVPTIALPLAAAVLVGVRAGLFWTLIGVVWAAFLAPMVRSDFDSGIGYASAIMTTVIGIAGAIIESTRARAVAAQMRTDFELETLARSTASASGNELFPAIARAIAETLSVRAALITELIGERLGVLAFWDGNELIEGIGEFPAAESPCGKLIDEGMLYLPAASPDDFAGISELVTSFRVKACCGVALGPRGSPVGTLVLLHDQPLERDLTQHPALRIVAARAAAEIDNRRADAVRRRLDRQMQETQRLESLGVLAGGMAHDFNNLLTIIIGNADIVEQGLPRDDPLRENVDDILNAADRAASLTSTMLDYVGGTPREHQPIDLVALTRDTVAFLRSGVTKKARIELELPNEAFVVGDGSQLGQVLINVITNAVEALPGGSGNITVKIAERQLTQTDVDDAFQSHLQPGPAFVLAVTDDGEGMDEQTRRRLFDPFFTTKGTGRGLGLSAVLGIVRSHGGAVRLESSPGVGTTVEIALPQTSQTALDRVAWVSLDADSSGRVLVIDDEPGVRNMAARTLRRRGYDVVVADSGMDGLAKFRAGGEFACVVLDFAMPDMDGIEVREALGRIDGRVPVLMMSGFTEAALAGSSRDDVPFIRKPFRTERLIRAVDELMRRRQRAAAWPE